MGLRGTPAPCAGRRRAGCGAVEPPMPGGRGQGVGLRETVLLGEAREGAWEGEDPPGKELRTSVVLSCSGSKRPALSCSPLPKTLLCSLPPSFPLAGTGSEEAKGIDKGEPRASIWRAACLGRESGGGNVSRSGAKAGVGFACG